MHSFSEFTIIEANSDKLHRLLLHYGYRRSGTGYTHPDMGSSATVSSDGWTHSDGTTMKHGKSRHGLDKHLSVFHQPSLF